MTWPTDRVDPTAHLHKSVWVGPGAQIGPGANLGRGVVVKAGAQIGPGVWIRAEGAVVGRRAVIKAGAKIWRGGPVAIADRVTIGRGAWIGGGATVARDVGRGEKVPAVGPVATGSTWAKMVADRGNARWIHDSARIGRDVEIGPGAWIGLRIPEHSDH